MIEYLETLPPSKHPFPFNLCIGSYLPTGNDYLRYFFLHFFFIFSSKFKCLLLIRYAKFGTLQYCVMRPSMAILAFLLCE